MRVFADVEEFRQMAGQQLGASDWVTITQRDIDSFAQVTRDDQWIHVDVDRAKDGPYGTTIVHGLLTLSLIPALLRQIYRVDGIAQAVNYGSNRVRYPAPVRVGSRCRASAELLEVAAYGQTGNSLATVRTTVEVKGLGRPACVADTISLLVM